VKPNYRVRFSFVRVYGIGPGYWGAPGTWWYVYVDGSWRLHT